MKYSCNWEHTVLQKMEENREFQNLVSKAVSLPVDVLIFASRKGYTGFWLVNTLKLLMLVGTASAPHFKSNYILGEWVKMYKPKFRHQALKIMDEYNIDSFRIFVYLQACSDKTYSSNPTLTSAPFRFTSQANTSCRDISWLFFQFLNPCPESSDRGN